MDIKQKMKWLLAKKVSGYEIGDMVPIIIAFGLIAIIGAVVLLILGNFQQNGSIGNTCANTLGSNVIQNGVCVNTANTLNSPGTTFSAAYNGLSYGVSGLNQIMTFLPLIALVIVAAVIIGTVVGAFVLGGGAKKEF